MEAIPKSGYYYPNRFALITLTALEDVMGKNGLNAILNLATLPRLIDNYPPANLEKQFDFSDYSMINSALEEMYGPRGGRSLALRAGRATFQDALKNFGAMAGVSDLAFKLLPLNAKLRLGLPAMGRIFSQVSDQHSRVEETDAAFHYIIERCPVCWGRAGESNPVCHMAAGLLAEGLKWVSGGHEFKVTETECVAMGGRSCRFEILKEPVE
jgi:predicted hydrocarbon binding protein